MIRLGIELLKEIYFLKKSNIYWGIIYIKYLSSVCVCITHNIYNYMCVYINNFWVCHTHTAINHCFTKLSNIPIIVKIFLWPTGVSLFPHSVFCQSVIWFLHFSFACSRMWCYWNQLWKLSDSAFVEYICGLFHGIVSVVFLYKGDIMIY